jgi:hypothetical protein
MVFYGIINVLALVMFIASLILFIIIHIKNKEYSIIKNAVSDYAVGSTNKLFRIYLWAGNLGYIFLFFTVLVNPVLRLDNVFIILLALIIIFRILLGFFKTNIEGQKLTTKGIIHYLLAIGNFGFNYTFIVKYDIKSKMINLLQNYQSLMQIYEIALTIALVGVVVTMFKPLRLLFGIIERIYILGIGIWFIGICSIYLFIIH